MSICKKLKKCLTSIIVMVMILNVAVAVCPVNVHAADSVSANYYNVVMVIDGSGSLVSSKNGTDKEGYRYVAAKLFLGLLTDSGNNVGAIVFDDGILVDTGIKKMSGSEAKRKLFNQINEQVNPTGSTNIGASLEQAVSELVEAQKKNGLPSVVVMMTDGKTDLDNDPDSLSSEEKQALKKESDAIETANQNNIKIYSVLLNGNGNGSDEEIRAMANNNKDQYAMVNDAKDLQDTFSMFYTMIYGSFSNDKADKFDADGNAEVKIDVPAFGVEEVNIVIKTKSGLKEDAVTLLDPDGKLMDKEDLNDAMIASKGFNLIKIAKPQPGTWTVKVKGVPGDSVLFNYVYNDNLSIKLEDLTKKGTYFSKNSVKLGASLYAGKKMVTGDILDPSYVILTLKDADGKVYEVNPEVKAVEKGYELTFDIPEVKKGIDMTAVVSACIPIGDSQDGIKAASAEVHLAVNPLSDNHVPAPKENPLQVEVQDSGDGKAYYKLDDWFVDEDEGAELSFSIVSSDYSAQELYINQEKVLVAEAKGMLSGSASVQATDENGGSGILNVEFLGNNPPEAKEDSTTVTITKQFGASKIEETDLTEWFSDSDGDPLTLAIVDSDYENGEVSLNGTILTSVRKSMEKGSIVIQAQDPDGASCEMTVHFKVRNLALWESVGALTILAVSAIIAIVLAVIAATRKFKGVIEVESLVQKSSGTGTNIFGDTFGGGFGGGFDSSFGSRASAAQKDVFGPFHGKKYMRTIMVDNGGLDKKAKFTVISGKKACFSSPKPFYVSGGTAKKKVNLSIGTVIEIYSDPECTKGILVTVKEYSGNGTSDPLSTPPTGGSSSTFGGGW